jgi:hypothetical protein
MKLSYPTFRSYVMNYKPRNKIAGDFVGDAKGDHDFPNVSTWTELRDYLWSCNACDGAMEAARIVWHSWRSYQKRNKEQLS